MFFNSSSFLFVFLPCVLLLYRASWPHPIKLHTLLLVASCVFYGLWSLQYLGLLWLSILLNYLAGHQIVRLSGGHRLALTAISISANLGCLIYFKYWGFFQDIAAQLLGHSVIPAVSFIPLGISFYTFTQITFLVECHQGGRLLLSRLGYPLFVTYFPHMVAGPILRHHNTLEEIKRPPVPLNRKRLGIAFSLFSLGLFKKVVIADSLAPFANHLFDLNARQSGLPPCEAWAAALAYTFQLYYDFSGYSDMAAGLAFAMGIRVPLNFFSPYKAQSLIDFWRRWHISLGLFFRDFVYIPLGGNRRGAIRQFANLLVVMMLCGLWHGAAWTFVVWGILHGLGLLANHGLGHLLPSCGSLWRRRTGQVATFLFVTSAWVVFRSSSLDTAWTLLRSMTTALADFGRYAISGNAVMLSLTTDAVVWGGDPRALLFWLLFAGLTAFFAPNVYQLFHRHSPVLGLENYSTQSTWQDRLHFRFNSWWAILSGVLFLSSVIALNIGRSVEFLYYQF